MFILLTSSQAVAKKIVLDCVAENSLMFETMTFDYSIAGKKQKLIIDTSDKSILFVGPKYDRDFVKKDGVFAASNSISEETEMFNRLTISPDGIASNMIWLKGEPLWMNRWSCEAGKALW